MIERDLEMLRDLIWSYDNVRDVRTRAGEPDVESIGVAPMDCGGTNGSDHSYRLTKLVKMGLAEHRKRGYPWGRSPGRRYRGSKVYRPTPAGREAADIKPSGHLTTSVDVG